MESGRRHPRPRLSTTLLMEHLFGGTRQEGSATRSGQRLRTVVVLHQQSNSAPSKYQNLFFVAALAGYVFNVVGAFICYPLWLALASVCFASPYFIMMLMVLPMLKEVYIEEYGNAAV